MLSLEVRSKKSEQDIAKRLEDFFGPRGVGLEQRNEDGAYVFAGVDGHVIARLSTEGKQTVIDFQTREYEHEVTRFAREVA